MNRSNPVYSAAIGAGRLLFGFWRLRRSATGLDNIPRSGGAVIAMTHFGYLEFALVEWVTWQHNRRHIRFMVQKRAFDRPLVGWLLRQMGHIEVDMEDGGAAYTAAVTALRDGDLVGVFPEAGVSASFVVRELKTGAARMSMDAGVPIVPVAGWGGHRLMTKNRRITTRDRIGVPVTFAAAEPIEATVDEDPHALTARLHAAMQQLTDELQQRYPVSGRGQWWQPRHLGGTAPTTAEAAEADERRRLKREQDAAAASTNSRSR